MPIRINLKEIFPSDAQEINVDKINFNFNKLLELGIGEKGDIGTTGPEGSAGPIGLTGDEGDRGNIWYVDAGDPNTLTFTGLVDGDMYLDSNDSSIWQYDGSSSPGVWNLVADLSSAVSNILITQGITFVRGFGETSPFDDRYIMFANRGDNLTDRLSDVQLGNPSNNDIFFLNNFSEVFLAQNGEPIVNFPIDTNEEYNALQKIYVDHSQFPLGRYHLELGSLYSDTRTSPADIKMSDLNHNLKVRFIKADIGGSAEYANTNHFINTARFSLSKPELGGTIDENGMFEFIVPKYNNEFGVVESEVFLRFGAKESLGEFSPYSSDFQSDGISIVRGTYATSLGIATDFYKGGNYGLIDVANLDGIFLNNEVVQTGGSITQVVTTNPEQIDLYGGSSGIGTGQYMNQGIITSGDSIWIVSGQGNTQSRFSNGVIQKLDISDPGNPTLAMSRGGDRAVSTAAFTGTKSADQHGHDVLGNGLPFDPKVYGLSKDIAEFGRYIIGVSHAASGSGGLPSTSSSQTTFYVVETDSVHDMYVIEQSSADELEDAYRVLVNGKYAWVITNRTYVTGPQDSSSLAQARLTAVDLTDPENVVIADSYQEQNNGIIPGKGTKYLDFDIYDNKAVVLKYTNYSDPADPPEPKHELELLVFDIQDPENFSSLTYEKYSFLGNTIESFPISSTLSTFTTNTTGVEHGAVTTSGRYAYVVHDDSMYIRRINNNYSTTSVSTSQLFSLAPNGTTASDIKVSGRYAYILINYGDSTGSVQVWDISDPTSPEKVAETRNSDLYLSSRMALNGKYLYVVSNNEDRVFVITIDIDGIDSPAARIGDLRVDDVNVLGDLRVKDNVNIKGALNVGPGGIYVDKGNGVAADGIFDSTRYLNTRRGGSTDIEIDTELFTGLPLGVEYLRSRTIIDDLVLNPSGGSSDLLSVDVAIIRESSIDNVSNIAGTLIGIQENEIDIDFNVILSSMAVSNNLEINADNLYIYNGQVSQEDNLNVGDVYVYNASVSLNDNFNVDDSYLYHGSYAANTGTANKWGIYINGEDENYLSGNLEVGGDETLQGNLDLAGSGSRIDNSGDSLTSIVTDSRYDVFTNGIETNAVSSGRLKITGFESGPSANGLLNTANNFVQWIRIGKVVHCHFRVVLDNLDTNGHAIALPTFGHSLGFFEGFGFIDPTGAASLPGAASQNKCKVVVQNNGASDGNPSVRCVYTNNNNTVGQGVTAENGSLLYGSFSYIISQEVNPY